MLGYSTTLRSMTKGSASYSMEFLHHGDLSKAEQESLIRELQGL